MKRDKLPKTFFILTVCLFFASVGVILMFLTEPLTWKMVSTILIKLIGALLFVGALYVLRMLIGLHKK